MKSSYRDLEPGTAPAGYKLGLARTHLTASMKFFFCGVDSVRLEVQGCKLSASLAVGSHVDKPFFPNLQVVLVATAALRRRHTGLDIGKSLRVQGLEGFAILDIGLRV
jgi:hypothetical protein